MRAPPQWKRWIVGLGLVPLAVGPGAAQTASQPAPLPGIAAPACPPVPCPPGQSAPTPSVPGVMPGVPAAPGAPGATLPPATPGTPAPPTAVPTPDAPSPTAQLATNAAQFAEAPSAGTDRGADVLPNLMGDLPGGAVIPGPIAVRVAPNGQILGPPITVILPNGQRQTIGSVAGRPSDEPLFAQPNGAQPNPNAPGTRTVALFPPPGAVFAPEESNRVSRVPLFVNGAFKITENDSPRPTTRAYFLYNYYDQVFGSQGDPATPRIQLHQEMIGLEYAFADRQASVGVRLPYNQLVSVPGFLNDTSLGDLTFITKAVLLENRETGDLLSAGLAVTVPTGSVPFASTLGTAEFIHSTLLQPYMGYIWTRGDLFAQGFNSIVVPTDDSDVTFMAFDLATGYVAYKRPGAALSAWIPAAEFHLNTPLNHRGLTAESAGFVDQLTILGTSHFILYDKSSVAFSAGAPVTGPRSFSLQAGVQFNFRF